MEAQQPRQMHQMIVSLGSNTPDRSERMAGALRWLRQTCGVEYASEVYNTRAHSGCAPDYLNQVVVVRSATSPADFQALCKDYERAQGRTPEQKCRGCVCVDLDVMWSDGQWLRPDEKELPYFVQGFAQVQIFLSK